MFRTKKDITDFKAEFPNFFQNKMEQLIGSAKKTFTNEALIALTFNDENTFMRFNELYKTKYHSFPEAEAAQFRVLLSAQTFNDILGSNAFEPLFRKHRNLSLLKLINNAEKICRDDGYVNLIFLNKPAMDNFIKFFQLRFPDTRIPKANSYFQQNASTYVYRTSIDSEHYNKIMGTDKFEELYDQQSIQQNRFGR